MASILIRAGEGYAVDYANSTGVCFFGAGGAGYSIAVDEYNSTTFIGNSAGTVTSAQVDNNKWVAATGVVYGSSSQWYRLTEMPQDKATINMSFSNATAVDVQNVELRAYDGSDISNAPSGLEIKMFEILHPAITYTNTGSGDTYWTNASGSTGILSLSDSPGSSALTAFSGGTIASAWHDWYIGISVKPTSVGSKTGNKIYMSLEYL